LLIITRPSWLQDNRRLLLRLTRKPNKSAKDNSRRSTRIKRRLREKSENLKLVLDKKTMLPANERRQRGKENKKLKGKSRRLKKEKEKLQRRSKRPTTCLNLQPTTPMKAGSASTTLISALEMLALTAI
jgi:hypothetical protein